MKEVVIVDACRTAVGKLGGMLSDIPAKTLGAAVISALLERTKVQPQHIDEVIMGQVLTGGAGQNPARQAAMEGGLLVQTPAFVVNKVCGSSLKAVEIAAKSIMCGDADIIVAGGQESMDLAPHFLKGSRKGKRLGDWPLQDSALNDGLIDAFNNYLMGVTAENVAEKYKISRQEQDQFAFESQMKVKNAIELEKFREEIIPIVIPQLKKSTIIFDKDEHPRLDTTLEALAKLNAAFKEGGSVTAGNSTGINNGAAAVMLMSEEKASELKLSSLARIVGFASVGVDPKIMGLGPIPAIQKCLKKVKWDIKDLDLIEINEAFAVQVIAAIKELKLNRDIVNVNGGAIALGHPIGASGARILVTLIHEMIKRGVKRGVASLCIGGGMGIAIAVER